MAALTDAHKRRSLTEVIAQWWQDWTNPRSDFSDSSCCVTGEVERVAREAGVTVAELKTLARLGPDAADLLPRREAALGLNSVEVMRAAPRTVQDLQRVCSMCECQKQCARDLTLNPTDPAWEKYCPNVETLKALNAMPWASRNPR
jgi:hypothetical protein